MYSNHLEEPGVGYGWPPRQGCPEGWPSSPPSPSSICPTWLLQSPPPPTQCSRLQLRQAPSRCLAFLCFPRGVLLSTFLRWHHKRYRHALWNHCSPWSHHRVSLHPGGDPHASEQGELTSLSSGWLAQARAPSYKPVNTVCAAFSVSTKHD